MEKAIGAVGVWACRDAAAAALPATAAPASSSSAKTSPRTRRGLPVVLRALRGGGTSCVASGHPSRSSVAAPAAHNDDAQRCLKVTAAGSPHLDLRCRLDKVPVATTVSGLKRLIEGKMGGHPPPAAQRLVFGVRELSDGEALEALAFPGEAAAGGQGFGDFNDFDDDAAAPR